MTTLTASTLAKTAVTSPAGTEVLRLIDGSQAKQITLANLRTYNQPIGNIGINLMDYIPSAQRAAIIARTSTYDATTVTQAALAAASAAKCPLIVPAGKYRMLGNLTVPVGFDSAVNIIGQGQWQQSEFQFHGTGAPEGLYFQGSPYAKAPGISDMAITASNGATRGVTFYGLSQPFMQRCNVYDFAETAVKFDTCIMPTQISNLIWSSGSASNAQLVYDYCTTVNNFGVYVGGGNSGCVAGMDFQRVSGAATIGGAIESCGKLIRIDGVSAYDGQYSSGLKFVGVDLENPGACFIEIGAGMSTNANGPRIIKFDTVTGYLSGATGVVNFAVIKNASQVFFTNCNTPTSAAPTGTATFAIQGTCYGVEISPTRTAQGDGVPWVTVGGTQRKDATPLGRFQLDEINQLEATDSSKLTVNSATPSLLADATQGGYYRLYYTLNTSSTSITQFTNGQAWMEISVVVEDANTTFVHQAGTVANAIKTTTGANVTAVQGRTYKFRRSAVNSMWYQL